MTTGDDPEEKERQTAARETEEGDLIRLDARDSLAFAWNLIDPPEPSEKLIEALLSARELKRE